MAKYTYKQENNKYVFYKDEKPLTNPHGIVITTDDDELDEEESAKEEFDEDKYARHRSELSHVIDTFIYYFSM